MKNKFFIFIFLLVIFCKEDDKFLGYWYVNRTDLENNQIFISKSDDNYIIEINNIKLIGVKENNVINIDNKGQVIKAILSNNDELIIDGETATRSNPFKSEEKSLFEKDEKETVSKIDKRNLQNSNELSSFGNASINGRNVIFREHHSTSSRSLGSFSSNERVLVLDEYNPLNLDEAITKSPIKLYNSYGDNVFTLPKGKAVKIINDEGGLYEVSFKHSQFGLLYAKINSYDLEIIAGDKWYKVKRESGKIGWVFSKFVIY